MKLLAVVTFAVLVFSNECGLPAAKSPSATKRVLDKHAVAKHVVAKHVVVKPLVSSSTSSSKSLSTEDVLIKQVAGSVEAAAPTKKPIVEKPLSKKHVTMKPVVAKPTVTKLHAGKTSKPWAVAKSVIIQRPAGTREGVIRSMANNPILERLFEERSEALKKADIVDKQIKQLLERIPVARDFGDVSSRHNQEASSAPSFLVPGSLDPRDALSDAAGLQAGTTGAFNVQGGTMVLGPANAGAVSGLMAGFENANVRSKAPSTEHAEHKSDVSESFNDVQSFILYPDSNTVVPMPNAQNKVNPAYPSNDASAVNPSSIFTAVTPAYPSAVTDVSPVYSNTAANIANPIYANVAGNTAVPAYPNNAAGTTNMGFSSTSDAVNTVRPENPANTFANDMNQPSQPIAGVALSNTTAGIEYAQNTAGSVVDINPKDETQEADDFPLDDKDIELVLGDPKRFDEKCAVLKLTFERSQGDMVYDDSLEDNDAQLENGAFVSDDSAKSGLAMNLGENGYLELADNFKGKPHKAVAISMWVKLKDNQGNNSLFRAMDENNFVYYDLSVVNGKGLWVHRDDAGNELFHVESNNTKAFLPGVWHHVLGSYSAKQHKASLWVDGKEIGTKSGITGNLSMKWNRVQMFEGKTAGIADNIFMFRCPLDRTKIVALFVSSASPKDAKKALIPRPRHR